MKNLSETAALKRHPDVIARENSDGTVSILNLNNYAKYFTMDGVAKDFWTMINAKRSFRDICGQLSKQLEVPVELVTAKARPWLKDLKKHQLVE